MNVSITIIDKYYFINNKCIYLLKKLDKIKFVHGNNMIYNDFSIEFIKGNTYPILGENGSGKSTLIDIIIG